MGDSKLIHIGWIMFTFSGVLFLISAWKAGDWFAFSGSVVWIAGVGLFLRGTRT